MSIKKGRSQIKWGMVLSFINIGIGNIIPLFYTPIMLSLMGKNEYGLYKLSSSTTSYLSLLSFGIGAAVTRYLIKARINEGKEAEEKVFGLFLVIFGLIAAFTLVVGAVLTLNLGLFYSNSLTDVELSRMKIVVAIMVINMAVSFSASAYNAVASSHERFIFIQCINILSTIGIPVVNLVVLYMGYRSIGMAVVSLCINVIIRLAYIVYVSIQLKIRPIYKDLQFGLMKEIIVFSFWIFVVNIVGQLFTATDTVIIGMIPKLATTGVAVYSIGYTFPNMLFSLAQVTPGLFMPRANEMVFKGNSDEELTNLVIKVGRIQCFIVALFCSGFIALGRQFLDWYVGPDYWEAYWVAVIIMIPNCIPLVQSAANSIIQAQNKHQIRSKVYIVIALINVVCTYFLVQKFGIIGAAIPTGCVYFIGHGLIMNWYYYRRIHLNIPRFWRQILPIDVAALIVCVITIVISKYIDFVRIPVFFTGVVIYTMIYAILLWLFVMNDYEKGLVKSISRFRRS